MHCTCSYLLLCNYNIEKLGGPGDLDETKKWGMRLIIYVLLYSAVFMILGSLIVTF
jgi:hypothetical protein